MQKILVYMLTLVVKVKMKTKKTYKRFVKENEDGYDQAIKDFVKIFITFKRRRNKKWTFLDDWLLRIMRKVAGLIRIAYIIGRMYENILEEDIIKECGRALNPTGRTGNYDDKPLSFTRCTRLNNPNNEPKHSPMNLHNLWWDGIGEWKG